MVTVNSLVPGRDGCNLKFVIFKVISRIDTLRFPVKLPSSVNIDSGNGLVPSDNEPLPEPVWNHYPKQCDSSFISLYGIVRANEFISYYKRHPINHPLKGEIWGVFCDFNVLTISLATADNVAYLIIKTSTRNKISQATKVSKIRATCYYNYTELFSLPGSVTRIEKDQMEMAAILQMTFSSAFPCRKKSPHCDLMSTEIFSWGFI